MLRSVAGLPIPGHTTPTGPGPHLKEDRFMNRAAAFLTTLFLIGSDRLASARKDRGATAVEYGLLVGLIAVVIIAAVTLLGDTAQGPCSRPSRTALRGGAA